MRVPAWVRCLAVLVGFLAFFIVTYFGLTSPVLPYSKIDQYTVDRVLDKARGGDIRPGDIILKFNGLPYYPCVYLVQSPIYSAPRNAPIPFEYLRQGETGATSIEIVSPSASDMLNRAPVYAIFLIYLVTGSIILIGSPPLFPAVLVGLTALAAGLVLGSGPNLSDFNAPLSAFYWLGIPLWATLQVTSQALWPVNLWRRQHVRVLVFMQWGISLAFAAVTIAAEPALGCHAEGLLFALANWLFLICFGLPFLVTLYLLILAYRSSADPISRLRIRALAWADAIGIGAPLLLSVVPEFFSRLWVMPPELSLLFTGIIPLAYLFAIYRGELMAVTRYLNRLIFMGAFFTVWVVITWTLTSAILYWVPDPNVKIVALVVTIPPLLLATTLRDRLGLWVDLALNGVHYKIEKAIASVGEALAGVIDEEGLAHVVVRRMPSVLLIQQAALWLPTDDGCWRLVAHSHRPDARGTILPQSEEAFFAQPQTVEVIESPHYLESDPTPWQVILRFRTNGDRPLGVALFGARLREKLYSGRDVQTLTTLASWITTTIVNLNVLANQRTAAERERQLMQKLAETEEDTRIALAAELHDQGISALSLVRLMLNQKREPALIVAAVERVIKDLRGITDNRVNPSGLGQGLAQALEAMTAKQRYTGIPVTFSLAEGYEESQSLSLLGRRELYYIAQEAVVNAVKHAQASEITVSLSRAGDTVQLSITDNGKGFDANGLLGGRATRGVGIMQARASRIGGKFSIVSQPGQGTTVRVEWSPSN